MCAQMRTTPGQSDLVEGTLTWMKVLAELQSQKLS